MKATSSPLLKTDAVRFLHPPQNVSSLVQNFFKIKIHSFRFSTWAHFWNTAHAAIHSSPTQCFLKMNYVLASKQNGHRVICAQCHGLRLTEQSWGWKSDVGCFRRCLWSLFWQLQLSWYPHQNIYRSSGIRGFIFRFVRKRRDFPKRSSKVSLIIKHLLTWKYRKAPGTSEIDAKQQPRRIRWGTVL